MTSRFRWGSVALALPALALIAGCTGGTDDVGNPRPPTTASPEDRAVEQIIQSVSSIRPGDPAGFDPASWAAIGGATVLPPDAALSVVDDSVQITSDVASVDVVVSVPGHAEERNWVFLRKERENWLVVATLPLETEP